MIRFNISLIAAATLAVGLCAVAAPARADAFMDGVKAEVVKFAGPQSDWRGPTSAPKPDSGKLIVYMSTDEQNDASREWGQAIQEAGAKIGWKVVIVDGHGTPVGWQQGLNQAIALKADGIVTNADAASLKPIIMDANDKGIVVVGIHATAFPGPQPDVGLFVNIQQDPRDIGRAQADWIIENSNGKARVVVTSHCEYAIACAKAHATEARIKECPGCQVLEFNSSPIAEVAQRQSPLVTASEPYKMQGYQAIDELNRAFHKMPPSGFVQTPYLVTPQNIHAEGGDKNTFIPSNNYEQHYLALWGVKS